MENFLRLKFDLAKLMKEIRPVIKGKKEFVSVAKSKILAYFGVLGLSEVWTKEQKSISQIVTSSTVVDLPIHTLMKEIEPLVTVKSQFKHRKESKLMAFFAQFVHWFFWWKDWTKQVFTLFIF